MAFFRWRKCLFHLVFGTVLLTSASASGRSHDPLSESPRGGILIDVLGAASPGHPAVTIRVSAWWEPHPQYLWFEGARFDLTSGPSGAFSNPTVLPVFTRRIPSPFSHAGVVSAQLIDDIVLDQAFRPHVSLFPLWDNPLPLWEVTWTTSDFTPRQVPVETVRTQFFVVAPNGALQYERGSASIRVVPAPSGALLLIPVLAFTAQRRR